MSRLALQRMLVPACVVVLRILHPERTSPVHRLVRHHLPHWQSLLAVVAVVALEHVWRGSNYQCTRL